MNFLLELLLLHSISFGMLYFHFHLSQGIFYNLGYLFWASQVGISGKEPACQCRRCKRHAFNAWVRKIPCRRKWQPTPVFLEKPMNRGACQATVHRITKSWTRLKCLSMYLFLAVLGLCCCMSVYLVVVSGATLQWQSAGFSSQGLLLLQSMGSRACRLQ